MLPKSLEEHPNYYAIIPADVRYCKELPNGAKLLYGEITALSNSKRRCNARNKYFAELYGVDVRTIKNWIRLLEEHGFIEKWAQSETASGCRELRIAGLSQETYSLESYEEILKSCGIRGELRRAMFEFIKHCQLNGRIMTNDKLYSIIVRLDLQHGNDTQGKIDSLTMARNRGWFDIRER